jgi:hypothetical protein
MVVVTEGETIELEILDLVHPVTILDLKPSNPSKSVMLRSSDWFEIKFDYMQAKVKLFKYFN